MKNNHHCGFGHRARNDGRLFSDLGAVVLVGFLAGRLTVAVRQSTRSSTQKP